MAEEEGKGVDELYAEAKFVPKEMKDMVNYVRGFQYAVNMMKSPAERAMEEAMQNSMTEKLTNVLMGKAATSPWTGFASNLALGLGQSAPQLIQVLTAAVGKERTERLVDTITSQELQTPQQTQRSVTTQGQNQIIQSIVDVDLNDEQAVLNVARSIGLGFKDIGNIRDYFVIVKREYAPQQIAPVVQPQVQTQAHVAQSSSVEKGISKNDIENIALTIGNTVSVQIQEAVIAKLDVLERRLKVLEEKPKPVAEVPRTPELLEKLKTD